MAVKVGTFTKDIAAAPAAQVVAGVGFPVKALILWSTSQTTQGSWTPHLFSEFGMTDGTSMRSVAVAMKDNISAAKDYRLFSDSALCFISEEGVLLAKATGVSFNDDGFTLTWTTNNASAYFIHYKAIGGDDLTDVALVPWTLTSGNGNLSVATVGFEPDCAIHLSGVAGTANLDSIYTNGSFLCVGAMDDAGRMWAMGSGGLYNATYGNLCTGANRSDQTFAIPSPGLLPTVRMKATYVSMDAGGFTINKNPGDTASWLMASLCLKGGSYYVGNFNTPAVVGNQSIGGLPFTPEGVFFFDARENDSTDDLAYRFMHGFGAIDGTDQAATAVYAPLTSKPTEKDAADWADRCIYMGRGAAATTDDAEFVSLDAAGWTLNWLNVVGAPPLTIGFIAFDTGPYTPPEPPPAPPRYTTAHRPPLTYSLTLMPSVVSSVGSVAPLDLTDMARNWQRSTRLQGGFWTGSFSITNPKRIFDAFDTWLGCHIEERSGAMVTWEGMIYEMELHTSGFIYRASLDDMTNRVRANYTDLAAADDEGETAWATNARSIARFGTKEAILDVDTESLDEAERARDSQLAEYGWPWPKIVGLCPLGPDELRASVNGYSFTLGWKYLSDAGCCDDTVLDVCAGTPACDILNLWNDGSGFGHSTHAGNASFYELGAGVDFRLYETQVADQPARNSLWFLDNTQETYWGYMGAAYQHVGPAFDGIDIYQDRELTTPGWNGPAWTGNPATAYVIRQGADVWIHEIVETDSEFLTCGPIQDNRIQVQRNTSNRGDTSTMTGWEAMQSDTCLFGVNLEPWRVWAGVGRQLHYEPISTTPTVYVMDGKWRAEPAASSINPWQLKPGVGKVLNYRWSPVRDGYWLPDPATFLMEEIAVDAAGTIQPSMAEISRTENLLSWMAALASSELQGRMPRPSFPPNWNVEAGEMNPIGDEPGGATNDANWHGYWAPDGYGGYEWIVDWTVEDLHQYYQ